MLRLALIGDRSPEVVAHTAIPRALELAVDAAKAGKFAADWIATDSIDATASQLAGRDGVWCVPGSPYRSMDGALAAIRFARENRVPFFGTCGGFQHAVIEFARHVAGIATADHAETSGSDAELVITPLSCSLAGTQETVSFTPGSQLAGILGNPSSREGYHCNYGLNADYRAQLEAAGLRFTGFDSAGNIRALELPGHPFFAGTLFQPERFALAGRVHPLIKAFICAAARKEAVARVRRTAAT